MKKMKLQERIAKLEARKQQLIAHLNATEGAIAELKSIMTEIEDTEKQEGQDALQRP